MPNQLADQTSPYLLQHKDNPVDWFPWGEEALAKARAEEKPIFLSIGYSACHWCHVMEHESFENESIAAFLNEHYVSIKVDREERPDLDSIYMNAVQMLTGRGGWPMSVFLTPDLKPFYGGTYWPPTAGRGMPGFDYILQAVHDAWHTRRDDAVATADELTKRIQELSLPDRGEIALDEALLGVACRRLERDFDPRHGGFGAAPKFPHSMDLQALMRNWQRTGRQAWLDMATLTLDKMHAGGMYDHLGGGFARYSVDERWLVPHFEKMLYDNALLAGAYLDAFLVTGEEMYARVARETLDYLLRDMQSPDGGFFSAEDADSEGVEGKFYVWTADGVRKVLGDEDAELFCRVYDVTPLGNFEGANILNLPKTIAQQATLLGYGEQELQAKLGECRAKLLEARSKRVRPGRDEKVLVNWNGLAIDALARAGAALGEDRYTQAACRAADFILQALSPAPGRLLHSWCAGKAAHNGYLDDYAALANGLVSLYETTFQTRYIDSAAALVDSILERFTAADAGVFYYTSTDHEQLIARTVELTDNATPSGASLAVTVLVKLGGLTGEGRYLDAAQAALQASASMIERVPIALGQMLLALDHYIGPAYELVFAGDDRAKQLAQSIQQRYLPRSVVAYSPMKRQQASVIDSLLNAKASNDGTPVLYACQRGVCNAPAVGEQAIQHALGELCNDH